MVIMNKSEQQYIQRIINKCVQEEIRHKINKPLFKKNLMKNNEYAINEKKTSKKAQDRKTVLSLLKNKKYKNSYLAYKLWHPKDKDEKDTYRSLFSKKASGKPDANGNVRQFTDDEITKLYELLRNNK